MNESDIYTFIGEVRAELRAIHTLLDTNHKDQAKRIEALEARVAVLEAWKANLMGRIAVWGTVIAAIGALLLALLK